jgi:acetoacetate decarboxylase
VRRGGQRLSARRWTARICEFVEYRLEELEIRGAWAGLGSLQLNPHALAPVAELPVLEVVSAVHFVADLTRGLTAIGNLSSAPCPECFATHPV